MKFTKMHGLGNDYLYVYGEVPEDVAELSQILSERHFGAGSDGMIYISPSEIADFKMRIFNADGSEAQMCGNGIRCVGKYVYDRGYTDRTEVSVETLAGIKYLQLHLKNGAVDTVTVDMGFAKAAEDADLTESLSFMKEEALKTENGTEVFPEGRVVLTPVSVGNPHAVTFVRDAEIIPLHVFGPEIEHHPHFPEGVNTEFVQVIGENRLRMRVWERGSGVTMACGTGACASAFAAVKKGLCDGSRPVEVVLDGGVLKIRVDEDDRIFMTGPAAFVYDGIYPAETVR